MLYCHTTGQLALHTCYVMIHVAYHLLHDSICLHRCLDPDWTLYGMQAILRMLFSRYLGERQFATHTGGQHTAYSLAVFNNCQTLKSAKQGVDHLGKHDLRDTTIADCCRQYCDRHLTDLS
jgi:hypothetical protein